MHIIYNFTYYDVYNMILYHVAYRNPPIHMVAISSIPILIVTMYVFLRFGTKCDKAIALATCPSGSFGPVLTYILTESLKSIMVELGQ